MEQGHVAFITVGWVGPDDDLPVVVNLDQMHKHCRPERVEELIDDLMVLCAEVEDRRKPSLRVVWEI